MNKDNIIKSYKNIETSVNKLRIKFKSVKQEWSKIQSRIKNGSGLAEEKEPQWWKYLNCVFSKINEVINLTSNAGQTSFVRNEDDDDQEDISNDSSQESDIDIGEENIQDSEDATTLDTGESQETNKQKIVVAPHKKRQQVRSNKQVLGEAANSLMVMAETSLRHLKTMAEEDKIIEGRYIAFRREEAKKNREQELRIAEIFARAAQLTSPPNFGFSHFPIGHTSTPKGSYIPNQTTKPASPDDHDPYRPYV